MVDLGLRFQLSVFDVLCGQRNSKYSDLQTGKLCCDFVNTRVPIIKVEVCVLLDKEVCIVWFVQRGLNVNFKCPFNSPRMEKYVYQYHWVQIKDKRCSCFCLYIFNHPFSVDHVFKLYMMLILKEWSFLYAYRNTALSQCREYFISWHSIYVHELFNLLAE